MDSLRNKVLNDEKNVVKLKKKKVSQIKKII